MSGTDLCEIQELLAQQNLETTRVPLHVMKGIMELVASPYNLLDGI